MSARSVHEAAVEAMAGALHARMHHAADRCRWEPCPSMDSESEAWAEELIAALVASVEVREGLVAAYYAQEGRWYEAEGAYKTDGTPIPGLRLWPLADVTLAALGGTNERGDA